MAGIELPRTIDVAIDGKRQVMVRGQCACIRERRGTHGRVAPRDHGRGVGEHASGGQCDVTAALDITREMERLRVHRHIATGIDRGCAYHRRAVQRKVGAGMQDAGIVHVAVRAHGELAVRVQLARIREILRGVNLRVSARVRLTGIVDGTGVHSEISRRQLALLPKSTRRA